MESYIYPTHVMNEVTQLLLKTELLLSSALPCLVRNTCCGHRFYGRPSPGRRRTDLPPPSQVSRAPGKRLGKLAFVQDPLRDVRGNRLCSSPGRQTEAHVGSPVRTSVCWRRPPTHHLFSIPQTSPGTNPYGWASR